MDFEDAFGDSVGYGPGIRASLKGHLVVSEPLTYLCKSEDSDDNAILVVAPRLIEHLRKGGAVPSVGSMSLFRGDAVIDGWLVRTGFGPLPVAFFRTSSIEFVDHGGRTIVYRNEA